MAIVNKAILIGRLGHSPTTKELATGTTLAGFNLATDRVYKKEGTDTITDWHSCTAFGKTAEFIRDYVKKGSLVYVEGRIEYDKYEGKDGVEKWATKIIVERLQLLDRKSDNQESDEDGFEKLKEEISENKEDDEDLPF